jgi:F-type H+-transporting ATPase subunit epsilon
MVVAPAWDGEVGVLRGHAPMLVLLGAGEMRITSGGSGSSSGSDVEGGFMQVGRRRGDRAERERPCS